MITGPGRNLQEEGLGGILADDMGHGKSLMMLSAIAGSLGAAFHYAASMTSAPCQTTEPVIAARSTLLVVPSACKDR